MWLLSVALAKYKYVNKQLVLTVPMKTHYEKQFYDIILSFESCAILFVKAIPLSGRHR